MARLAVIGAGWAGLAAAVHASRAGLAVTLFEASRQAGGRARTVSTRCPDGGSLELDNGQHILIGAYTATLSVMEQVGVRPDAVLSALPLALRGADGHGLALPRWPAPLDAAWGIATARGWTAGDKASLLRAALRWRLGGFRAPAGQTVGQLCEHLAPRVRRGLIEPLCVSALNTPMDRACAQVFLRVLQDSLFGRGWGRWGASWLLLPRVPLGELFPTPALRWLGAAGVPVRTGVRVQRLEPRAPGGWKVDGEAFDQVLLACPPGEAARLAEGAGQAAQHWRECARALNHEAIATVYALGGPRLPRPLLTLAEGPGAPAQFVFDRAQLGGPPGLLAFVVSASAGERASLQAQVLAQAASLGWEGLRPVTTLIERRATFACTPVLARPSAGIAPGLSACGDYVEGPYPATIEGAVRSAVAAVEAMGISEAARTAR
jgi:hydroxysqualene dehydroxylase